MAMAWISAAALVLHLFLSWLCIVKLGLEYWTLMVVILLAGLLKKPEIAVDAATICMNVEGWCFMIPIGFLAAISVRVSNELGAGHPRAAKFSVVVVVTMSVIIQTTFAFIIMLTRKNFPAIFTDRVAVGAGWQATVAYINIGCYYLVGLTSAVLMGLKFDLGLEGIWGGVLLGMLLQTIILLIITLRTDWNREAALSKERIQTWGGSLSIASVDSSRT
ncbi:Protein TRANSPARENT TESTA 12 [Acorus calamus]|uniref:Protein TRANSPARENT TESTA 12 n=1 Tax=Acorus calamus TaxID=4465 RepID=A0AAV9CG52_ACOCL|nr:Protein TRANSPARENT TESTA 12 [Acorus calamus]